MNVLFLSLIEFDSLEESNIYTDLLCKFRDNGHNIYAVSPIERRKHIQTKLIKENNCDILRLRIGNIQKTNFLEKGISTILLEKRLLSGIKKYFKNIKFDLVLYPTPPITVLDTVRYIKKRDNARTYLMLKDIFPQGAIDLGILTKHGVKGCIYNYFRRKEKQLYDISDFIGCMSPANIEYILLHNSNIEKGKVGLCHNSVAVCDMSITEEEIRFVRQQYNLPLDKKIFLYGGNLGRPQGIDFLLECLSTQHDNQEVFFLIIGSGTEFNKIDAFCRNELPSNVALMKALPSKEFHRIVAACDVGMIFLDNRFTIPNFPSRLLSYMQTRIPVLVVANDSTDIGLIVRDNGFGWWCDSSQSKNFKDLISDICVSDFTLMKKKEWNYLTQYYDVKECYANIMKQLYR